MSDNEYETQQECDMVTYEPKTKGDLMQVINEVLNRLWDDATSHDRATETVVITGDPKKLRSYIENVCDKYNEENKFWYCELECVDDEKKSDTYTFYVAERHCFDNYEQEEHSPNDPI